MLPDYATFVGQSENRNTVYETINGMMEIKSSGAHGSRLREWEKNQRKLIWLSSLDAINEILITERILRMQQGKTLIVSAHRLSTVKNADRILFMSDGRIVEEGRHEDLLALKGHYSRLVSNQLELAK